jgi:UDP-hydrolysing UDP-N-acetyl-D-glucosamine 2-epimerase
MRAIGVVTVARSDYGIYRPVLRELASRDDVELRLFVGGSHLVERFGTTVQEIERDGFPIVERVGFLDDDDSPLGVSEAIGRGVVGFARAFERSRPDLLVVLGDRFEMFAAGVAALPLGLPLAHIHGGERTEGAADEAWRHALTKLSHLHFAATDEYARRIVQLGEEPWRVVVSGAPALDAVRELDPMGDDELAAFGVRLRGPTLLVTYHPATLAPDRTGSELRAILGAVDASGLDAIFTFPNADAQHGFVIAELEGAVERGGGRYVLVRNLGQRAYFTLMQRAAAMVGNSSSGLIEAASFELPVVDVGMRQDGRIRPRNVIHVGDGAEVRTISAAIGEATSSDFRTSLRGLANPYGDGRASERIADRLVGVSVDERLTVKRFHDR